MAFSGELIPRVRIGNATVHVYGFMHGVTDGPLAHPEARKLLENETSGFGPGDYIMAEGQHDSHFESLGLPHTDAVDAIEKKLVRLGIQAHRIERPEFYEIIGLPSVDRELALEQHTVGRPTREESLAAERELSLQPIHEVMRPGIEKIKQYYKEREAELKEAFKGRRTPQEIRTYLEFKLPFRSLLLARAAQNRAEALGGHVRIFTGFLHVDQINRFLKRPQEVEQYVRLLKRSHPILGRLYEWHEQVNHQITEAFKHSEHLVLRNQRAEWLAFLSLQVQTAALKAQVSGTHERGSLAELVRRFKAEYR